MAMDRPWTLNHGHPYIQSTTVIIIFNNMTLQAGFANSTSLLSFMVWYCSVCELREPNKEEEEEEELWENRHFQFNPFAMHEF